MNFKIIMMSCDKYRCLTPAFDHCMDKYYSNHPDIEYIYGDDIWTKRLREKLETISDDYILFILDDMLIRQSVREDLIEDALKTLENDKSVAVINFEKNYREAKEYSKNWFEQKQGQMYLNSAQPSMWRRTALIENLWKDENPWSWELTRINDNYKYLINKNVDIINVGCKNDLNWGIARGKMTLEFRNFLISENMYTDDIKEAFE